MKSLQNILTEKMSAAFAAAGYDASYGLVRLSDRPDLCEFQCNGAMAGAKKYHKAPFMIAEDAVKKAEELFGTSFHPAGRDAEEDPDRLRRTERREAPPCRPPSERRHRREYQANPARRGP